MPKIVKYCLDTSVYVNSWRKHYPIDIEQFKPIWNRIDELGRSGKVFSPEEVWEELKNKDDELLAWIKSRRHLFLPPTEQVQAAMKAIMATHPRLVDTSRGRSIADPWVIAQAQVSSAIVVTEEERRIRPGKSPKIPDVCESLGIPYMSTLEFIRRTLRGK